MQENRNLQARHGSILLTLSSPKECVLIFAFDGFVEGGLRVTSLKTCQSKYGRTNRARELRWHESGCSESSPTMETY